MKNTKLAYKQKMIQRKLHRIRKTESEVAKLRDVKFKLENDAREIVSPKTLTSTYHGRTHMRGLSDVQAQAQLPDCKFNVCTNVFRCTTTCALRQFDSKKPANEESGPQHELQL